MVAIGNGLSAYGGFIPYTSTFFNFIEYCFPSVRLAALSHHQQVRCSFRCCVLPLHGDLIRPAGRRSWS
jgi:hypothetical protein